MMKFVLGLSILIILFSMGICYYRSCKKTADELVNEDIGGKDEMKKKDNLERKPDLKEILTQP